MLASLKSKFNKYAYARDEKGSIILFVLVVFSAMALVGGTAIDLARHETLRATLQYNLDRAVIAAASLKQTQDPTTIVNDYMSRIKTIENFSIVVDASVATNARSVTATASADLDTWFLSMAGVDKMPITTISAASEEIPNLEISLVLDISGSMADNSKIANLKTAAKQFVTQMLTGASSGQVAISIVPFSTSVAPSKGIYDALNVDEKHKFSRCLEFDTADFSNLEIDPAESQEQTIYTAPYGNWQAFQNTWESCITDTYHEITPYSQSITALHTKIDSMVAYSGTSGHIGAKWGTALLDPAFKPVAASLIADGDVHSDFGDLPVAYSNTETLKVMVIMGDGQNSKNFRFSTPSAYRGENSNLHLVKSESTFLYLDHFGQKIYGAANEAYCDYDNITCHYSSPTTYYIHKPGPNQYYNTSTGSWISAIQFDALKDQPGYAGQEQLSWEEAWSFIPVSRYDSIVGGTSAMDSFSGENFTNTTKENALMLDTCSSAKTAGIVIYSIGFEVPTDGVAEDTLRDCASTPSHYADAAGTEITTAFLAIAGSIKKLKLTQ